MNEDTVTVDTEEVETSGPVNDDTFDKEDICDGVMNYAAGMEITNPEAICAQAVDATLRYVVEWLHERGNMGPAEVLESIGEVG